MPYTILLTGISGFIPKHLALRLLQTGHAVRGTVRNADRATEVRDALRPHGEADAMDRLTFTQADRDCDDVRDVAEMHLRALQRPETAGRRYIAVAGSMGMADICRVLKASCPDRRIPTREAPKVLIRALAMFDGDLKSIVPSLGRMEQASNARATADMGMTFIPPRDAVVASARYLVDRRLV